MNGMASTLSLKDDAGNLIKIFASSNGTLTFGLHQLFGWISDAGSRSRMDYHRRSGRSRARRMLDGDAWLCRFRLEGSRLSPLDPPNASSIRIEERRPGVWSIETSRGKLELSQSVSSAVAGPGFANAPAAGIAAGAKKDRTLERALAAATLLALLFMAAGSLLQGSHTAIEAPVMEPVVVKILPEKQKAVRVVNPISENALPKSVQKVDAQARRAIQQNLGFLGMLGSKTLSKALGGAKTSIAASAGAGAGGDQGSGGELLVGLGQGVKRTTVGNSGVAGLGGVGTKGAGGGNGGYGNSAVGSGEGRALSAMAVSNDVVLEGGLDRAVIQATIAKYLNQVRACYEQGLSQSPGISGTVTMNFEVGPAGSLGFARVQKSTLGHAGTENCIAGRMMGWKFPKPLGGVAVKVSYPFLLRPVGG
jgi:hypothetical protein